MARSDGVRLNTATPSVDSMRCTEGGADNIGCDYEGPRPADGSPAAVGNISREAPELAAAPNQNASIIPGRSACQGAMPKYERLDHEQQNGGGES